MLVPHDPRYPHSIAYNDSVRCHYAMKLTSYVNAILCNIESNGLCRYDFNDLDKYIYEKYGIFKNNFYRKALRLLGIYFPISIRGLLGVQKSLNPAACYHLGMAYLSNERHDLGCRTPESAQEITQRAISNFYQEDSGLWLNPSGWVPLSEKSVRQKEGPPFHGHALCCAPEYLVVGALEAVWPGRSDGNRCLLGSCNLSLPQRHGDGRRHRIHQLL